MNSRLESIAKGYFTLLSKVNSKWASRQAALIFQFVPKRLPREFEQKVYEEGQLVTIPFLKKHINTYSLGSIENQTVFLLHGWGSVAGSMSQLASKLLSEGHHVVVMELPGHETSKFKLANLHMTANAFKEVIDHYKVKGPISAIGHSFGGMAICYALEEHNLIGKNIVTIATPHGIEEIFNEFVRRAGLSPKAKDHLYDYFEQITSRKLQDVKTGALLAKIKPDDCLIVHDESDAILAVSNAKEIQKAYPKGRLFLTQKSGHNKILSNKIVLEEVAKLMAIK